LIDDKEFEKFSAYKFSIGYPLVCRLEFSPKSRREAGDVVFHFPDREKIFISWGKLEDAQKKYPTLDGQAEHTIEVMKKNANPKTFERLAQDSLNIHSHKAAYNHARFDGYIGGGGLLPRRKTVRKEMLSVHLRCENGSRYFVIYSTPSINAPKDFSDLFLSMVKTFECH
jgi:hypothetical protein